MENDDHARDDAPAHPDGSHTASDPPTPSAAMPESPPASSAASKAFADAMAQLEQGEFDAAHRSLKQFARNHPSDARAEDADYLTIVALQRAGRHAAAAQAARHYLARYPKGARRAWAKTIARRAP